MRSGDKHRDPLFGYDFFVSYRRDDAEPYAEKLADALKHLGFEVFRDLDENPLGVPVTDEIQRAIRRSRLGVLIVTPGVLASRYVAYEIAQFLALRKRLIPIHVQELWQNATAEGTYLEPLLVNRNFVVESAEALTSAKPSERVVNGIAKSLRQFRSRTKRRLAISGIAVALSILCVVGIYQSWRAGAQRERAAAEAQERRKQEQLAKFRELAREASNAGVEPRRRMLLAGEAWRRTQGLDATVVEVATDALRRAVLDNGGIPLIAAVTDAPREHGGTKIACVGVSSDSRWIAAGIETGTGHSVQVLDLSAVDPMASRSELDLGPADTPPLFGTYSPSMLISPDGALIVLQSDDGTVRGAVRAWRRTPSGNWERRPVFEKKEGERQTATLSRNARWLILGDKMIDTHTGLQLSNKEAESHLAEFLPEGGSLVDWWTPVIPPVAPVPPTSDSKQEADAYKKALAEWEFERSAAHFSVTVADGGKVKKIIDLKEPSDLRIDTSANSHDGCWAAAGGVAAVLVRAIPCRDSKRTGLQRWNVTEWANGSSKQRASLDFSPDSSLLAAGGYGSRARVWALHAGEPAKEPTVLGAEAQYAGTELVLFSPHGKRLATGGTGVTLWNLESSGSFDQPVYRLAPKSTVDMLTFSRSGRFLASGRASIVLWDLASSDPQQFSIEIKPRLFDPSEDEDTMFFDSSSRWLVTVGRGVTGTYDLVLWPMHPDDLISAAQHKAGSGFNKEEWIALFGSEPYRPTFPSKNRN